LVSAHLILLEEDLAASVFAALVALADPVALADRVVVMSPRPGRITATIDVDLPAERSAETRDDPRFYELVSQVRHELNAASGPA
jgi:NitT/TauT family transport system ATP-binding protein